MMEQNFFNMLSNLFKLILDSLRVEISLGIVLLILFVLGTKLRFVPLLRLAYWFCLLKSQDLALRLGITGSLGDEYRKRAMRLSERKPERALAFLDDAIPLLEVAVKGSETSKLRKALVDSYNLRGKINLDSGDPIRAVSDFEKVIALQPANILLDKAYVQLAEAKLKGNDLVGAVEELRSANQKFPQSIAVQNALRTSLPQHRLEMYNKARWEEVIRDCDDLIRFCADKPAEIATSYFYRSDARRLQGDYKGAITDAELLLTHPSERSKGYLLLGLAKLGQQRFSDAVADLTKALNDPAATEPGMTGINSNINLAYMRRAYGRSMLSDFAGAVEDYTVLINRPGSLHEAGYFEGRGEAFYRQLKYKDALRDLTQAIELDGRNPRTHFLRGDTYRLLADLDKALADFREAGTLESEDRYWGDYGCGLVFHEKSKSIPEDHRSEKIESLNQARKHFRAALDKSKACKEQFSGLYRELATVESELGNSKESAQLREQARALERETGITIAQLSLQDMWPPVQEVLNVQDVSEVPDFAMTLEEFEERIRQQSNEPYAYYGAGVLYYKAKETAKSFQHLTKAIDLDPGFASAYYFRGWTRVQEKDWQGAISDANKAIELQPEMADAYRLRGTAYNNINKPVEAADNFSKAVECNPKFVEGYLALVHIRAQNNEWAKAVEEADRAIVYGVDHEDIYSIRGYAHLMLEKLDQAISDCNKALELREKTFAHRIRGFSFLQQRRFDEAIGDFTRAIDLDDKDGEAYGGLGEAHLLKGELDQALQDLKKAIELSPQGARAYYNSGLARIQRWVQSKHEEDLNQAFADFSEVIRLAKEHPAGYCSLGECYLLKGQLDEALTQLRKAINRDRNYSSAYQVRAWVYTQKGQWETALGDFSKALDLGSNDPKNVYYGRAECERMQKEWDAAMRDYSEAIQLDSEFAIAYSMRGLIRAEKLDWSGAIEDYSQGIKKGIETPEIFTYRARAYREKGDDLESLEDLKSAIDLDPKSVDAYDEWGSLLGTSRKWEQAIMKFSKVIELTPGSSLGYANRGWARCHNGDLEDAIKDLDKAIELAGRDSNTFDNRAWAKRLKGELDSALQDCEKAIELDPSNPYPYFDRSLVRWFMGNSSQALDDLNKVLEIRLLNFQLSAPRRVRIDSVNWGAYFQEWTRAVETAGNDPVAYFGRGISLWMADKLDTAIDDMNKALSLNSGLTYAARIRDLIIKETKDLGSAKKDQKSFPKVDSATRSAGSDM